MMRTLAMRVMRARKFSRELESSQADFLLPFMRRSLNTGMKETARAPEVRMKNIKSGMVKAAV